MPQLNDIEVIVFDVLGTLVDEPEGQRSAIREAFPQADPRQVQSLTESWQRYVRDQQAEIAEGRRAYVDSEMLDAEAATAVFDEAAGLGLPAAHDGAADLADPAPDPGARLATASRRLPPWPDSVAELERIAARLPVLALSNAGPTTLLHLSAHTGLRWHQAVTAHSMSAYKPAPSLYRRAVRVADRPPERILMVAAHAWDLRAAQNAGMRTCYVDRPVGDPQTASDHFDMTVAGLNEILPGLG
ncbi:haloacid dehalogenase type II [Microbacterium sp. AK031]|uniref:haloacid dehalogenase type II n=1 Tax=Microbacterium sp. AK031 TaxID=2723076 RepID=UPI0021674471|nr:haloacid dehalogenase type II [Microbacterium sp. AK031]MCS3844398.1 2-haloacid dehalogenase [Microbacterium sp. AK031]